MARPTLAANIAHEIFRSLFFRPKIFVRKHFRLFFAPKIFPGKFISAEFFCGPKTFSAENILADKKIGWKCFRPSFFSFDFFFVRLPFAATSFGVCCRFICRSLSLRSRVVCRSLPRCLPKRNEAALGRTGGLGSWVSSIGIEYMVFVLFVTHFLEYISLQNGLLYLVLRHRWVIEKMRCADRN